MKRWPMAVVFILLFALAVAMQARSGAFHADIGADDDEPAHAVSSLMVRDYLVQDFGGNPLSFAREFYAHYSKVAIGHWPPLFYVGEGLWMLAFGRTRVAMLLFIAVCGSGLLVSVSLAVWRWASLPAALASTAAIATLPAYQEMLVRIRPDLLLALLIFWSAILLERWCREPSRRNGVNAIAWTVIALMVHQRAAVLLLVPLCLLPFYPPRFPWRWVAGAAAVLLGSYVAHREDLIGGLTVQGLQEGLGQLVVDLPRASNAFSLLFAPLGVSLSSRPNAGRPFWRAMTGLLFAGMIFHLLAPVPWEIWYQLSMLIPAAALAGGGVQVLLQALCKARPGWLYWTHGAVAVMALASVAVLAPRVERKADAGYRELVAQGLLRGHAVSLVAGNPPHEGDLIAEASLADPNRRQTVLRASKVLETSSWSGYNFHLKYASANEVLRALDERGVTMIVVQRNFARPDVVQLQEALGQPASGWQRDTTTDHPGIDIYRRQDAPTS